ncbi:hypothetical protein GUITHDRAFT_152655 [Guillardia theta CCMP2712]|uniref:Uncharacterized protein n=2 Tax=Guillardia theta TaxID=55529 RepID=L1JAU5_GUITC|nr:hypothetical protein GUITHDRAFT_152655 [Guillardia theta CCMP2712]EKX45651.1 hypothetical protein GUITHDRAFT_152655 [Guillardia theta CCMP2712]|eukprot:XP_005832631.1 hypothetical protein GUITHDRAFT_152655 [Guillardia theta CCMP2712]
MTPLVMSAQFDRRTFGKVAGGAAALVLGKKVLDGGDYTGTPDLTGQVAVVTGANTGLGKETCIRLAKLGAEVVLASRSKERGEKAEKEIRALTGSDKLSTMELDLASLKSIELFASELRSRHDKIDLLVNNAGVMAIPTREETKDGLERQIGINHFGHFHLTNLLLPQIKKASEKSGDARIINLSSDAHLIAFNGMNFDDLQSKSSYDPWKAYGQSKLANILFTKELQRRLGADSPVSAAAVHPGVVRTELGRNFFLPPELCSSLGSVDCKGQLPPAALVAGAVLLPLAVYTSRDPAQGAQTQVRCSVDPELKGKLGGRYFRDCHEAAPSPAAQDASAALKLWEISEELTGSKFNV